MLTFQGVCRICAGPAPDSVSEGSDSRKGLSASHFFPPISQLTLSKNKRKIFIFGPFVFSKRRAEVMLISARTKLDQQFNHSKEVSESQTFQRTAFHCGHENA